VRRHAGAVCASITQRLLSLATPAVSLATPAVSLATPADMAGVWVAGLRVEAAAYPEPR
jgi:hypothetical protein